MESITIWGSLSLSNLSILCFCSTSCSCLSLLNSYSQLSATESLSSEWLLPFVESVSGFPMILKSQQRKLGFQQSSSHLFPSIHDLSAKLPIFKELKLFPCILFSTQLLCCLYWASSPVLFISSYLETVLPFFIYYTNYYHTEYLLH